MPLLARVRLSGPIAGTSAPATFTGAIVGGLVLATLTGMVSRERVDSFDADSVGIGVRVKLGSTWLPVTDIAGPLELRRSIDDWSQLGSIALRGSQYSIFVTEQTWTHTPIEVWLENGPLAATRDELRLAGYVVSCRQDPGPDPIVRIEFGDEGVLHRAALICYELEPLAGLRRGEIIREVCAQFGITVDCPDGEVYTKGINLQDAGLKDWVTAFAEPEGWSWDWTTARHLRAVLYELQPANRSADAVWTPADIIGGGPGSEPPRDVPNRFLGRGFGAVYVDELGVKTTVKRTVIEDLYTPRQAVKMQQTDGTLDDLSPVSLPEELRIVRIIEDQQVHRGDLLLRQYTTEDGWYNPEMAKLRTPDVAEGDGPVDGGYYWTEALIDEDGAYVQWTMERFIRLAEREVVPTYDEAGTVLSRRTRTNRWYKRTRGVKTVGASTLDMVLTGVGADDMSYLNLGTYPRVPIDQFGLAEELNETFTYGAAGAVVEERQETTSWYSPKCRTGPGVHSENVELADGTGQVDEVAIWQVSRDHRELTILTEDGLKGGTIKTERGFGHSNSAAGLYEWGGDKRSNSETETWRELHRENTQFNILTEESYEKVTYSSDGSTTKEVITGRLPVPRYRASVWTRLVQEPLELLLEDETLEAWFGARRQVIQSDHCQTPEELARVLRRRMARMLARKVTVNRYETFAGLGATVDVSWPLHGLAHRGLLADSRITRDLKVPSMLATYVLEVPL